MTRRLMYLQYLLKEDENSLLHQFFKAQADDPIRGEWFVQVKEDMKSIKLNISFDEIKIMSKEVFKKKVSSAVQKAGFWFLSSEKLKMSKVMSVQHESLSLQEYFHPSFLNIQEAKILFRMRSIMVDVKMNFKKKYTDTLCLVFKTAHKKTAQYPQILFTIRRLCIINLWTSRHISATPLIDSSPRPLSQENMLNSRPNISTVPPCLK